MPTLRDVSGEKELVKRAKDGDRSAFEELYRANVGRVHALVLRLSRDPAEAEDITQETFIRAWKKLETFEGRSRLSSWLHRMAVNLFFNARRSRGGPLETEPLPDEGSAAPVRAPRESPPASRLDLQAAVSTLPPGARTTFLLYDVFGFQHDEIAAMTGMAVGTSKAQLHRARRLLRECLSS